MENALILGAGPVGQSLAEEFRRRGVKVRLATRSGRGPAGFEVQALDARDAQAVKAAAQGATILVHAVGVPYPEWATELPPIQTAVLAAAEATGAVAVFVENLYAFEATMPLSEATPERPSSKKGEIRRQLTEQWREAHRSGRVKAVSVQASDYFGPGATRTDTSHFGNRFFPAFEAGKTTAFLGDPDQLHSMTYLPDYARALADVALSPEAWGQSWVCPCVGPTTFRAVAEAFGREAGRRVRVGTLPRGIVKLLGLFSPMIREVVEMLYQFEKPFTVDSRKFEARFGWKATDLGAAVKATWAAHSAKR